MSCIACLLRDGTSYEILKNFPSASELSAAGVRHGRAAEVIELDYYWLLTLTSS